MLTVSIILAVFTRLSIAQSDLVVETEKGLVKGFRQNFGFRSADVWNSIPYGKAPIGKLRFKHPQPRSPWKDVLDVSKSPNTCYFYDNAIMSGYSFLKSDTLVSEDCLYLTVTAPSNRNSSLLPVMFFIYGGTDMFGSTAIKQLDFPTVSAEENIIIVAPQFRNGPFGYLTTDTKNAPGNLGIKDVVLALKWTYSNIEKFGGDHEKITLLGQSSGGTLAGALAISIYGDIIPQVILLSGTPANALMGGPRSMALSLQQTEFLLERTNCKSPNVNASIDCLRELSPEELLSNSASGSFGPTFDPNLGLVAPRDVHSSLKFMENKRVLVGGVKDEAPISSAIIFPLQIRIDKVSEVSNGQLRAMLKTALPWFGYTPNEIDLIIYTYQDWNNPDNVVSNRDAIVNVISDLLFNCGLEDFIDGTSQAKWPTYRYLFDIPNYLGGVSPWIKTYSGLDLYYFIGNMADASTAYIGQIYRKYLTNFVKTGDPNGPDLPMWGNYDDQKRGFMNFNDTEGPNFVNSTRPNKNCPLWSKFLPLLKKGAGASKNIPDVTVSIGDTFDRDPGLLEKHTSITTTRMIRTTISHPSVKKDIESLHTISVESQPEGFQNIETQFNSKSSIISKEPNKIVTEYNSTLIRKFD